MLTLESIVQGQLPIIEAIILIGQGFNHFRKLSGISHMGGCQISIPQTGNWNGWSTRIEVMRSSLDAHGQEKTNRRLGRLTVLSMIFMPITFLAGVWGMNFEFMPCLHLKFGYLMALASYDTYFRRNVSLSIAERDGLNKLYIIDHSNSFQPRIHE